MRKVACSFAVLASTLLAVLCTFPANATGTNQRSWVANNGSDSNACTVSAPCLTFAGALTNTAAGGEINCLTPGSYGPVTIAQSITIDCAGVLAGITPTSGNPAITINVSSGLVTLKHLVIDGAGVGTNGIVISAAYSVQIGPVLVQNFTGTGIRDSRSTAGILGIGDTIVGNNGGPGIVVAGASGNGAELSHVGSFNNTYGLATANGNGVIVYFSDMNSNTIAGIEGDSGAFISVDYSNILGNPTGVVAYGSAAILLNNSSIMGNATGISGATQSYGNNRLSNPSNGTKPTIIGTE